MGTWISIRPFTCVTCGHPVEFADFFVKTCACDDHTCAVELITAAGRPYAMLVGYQVKD